MSQCLKAQKEGAIRTSDARPSQAEQTVSATMEVRQRGGGCLRDRELPGGAVGDQGVGMRPTKWGLTGTWETSVFSFTPS